MALGFLRNRHQAAPPVEPSVRESLDPADVRTRVQGVARSLGVEVEGQLLDTLAGMAKSGLGFREGLVEAYGLKVDPPDPKALLIGGREGRRITGVSRIDFRPITAGAPQGAETPQSEDVLQVTQTAVQGLRSFCLLVEAGYLERPTGLVSITNWQMLKVAQRAGFEETARTRLTQEESDAFAGSARERIKHERTRRHEVYADFEGMTNRVFSPEARRLEERLAARMTPQHVGDAAIHGAASM